MPDAITPEKVQQLLDDATPGPWETRIHCSGTSVSLPESPAQFGITGIINDPDATLIAAAPDIARAYLDLNRALVTGETGQVWKFLLSHAEAERDAEYRKYASEAERAETLEGERDALAAKIARIRLQCEKTEPPSDRSDPMPWDHVQKGLHEKAQAILKILRGDS